MCLTHGVVLPPHYVQPLKFVGPTYKIYGNVIPASFPSSLPKIFRIIIPVMADNSNEILTLLAKDELVIHMVNHPHNKNRYQPPEWKCDYSRQ